MNNENNELIKKSLDIIEQNKDKEMLMEIGGFLTDFLQPITSIQVNKLVLNDIEYPTEYSKIKQAKLEMISRYHSIIDIYYDYKKKELEIELMDEKIKNEKHPIKLKMKQLENEKNLLHLHSIKASLDNILKEINVYYEFYKKAGSVYTKLSDEEKSKLEEEFWAEKARNNPVIFEERYGNYIKEILGEIEYNKYLQNRKTTFGMFPRELIKQ